MNPRSPCMPWLDGRLLRPWFSYPKSGNMNLWCLLTMNRLIILLVIKWPIHFIYTWFLPSHLLCELLMRINGAAKKGLSICISCAANGSKMVGTIRLSGLQLEDNDNKVYMGESSKNATRHGCQLYSIHILKSCSQIIKAKELHVCNLYSLIWGSATTRKSHGHVTTMGKLYWHFSRAYKN